MPDERTTVPRQRLLLQSDLGSDALHVYRTGPRAAPGRGVRRGLDGDAIVFESDPAAPGAPFRIRANGQKFRWTEEGVLDLEGAAVPPGLHWHLPDRRKGMYSASAPKSPGIPGRPGTPTGATSCSATASRGSPSSTTRPGG